MKHITMPFKLASLRDRNRNQQSMGGGEAARLDRVRNVPGAVRPRWRPAGLSALLVPLAIWLGSACIGSAALEGAPAAPQASGAKPAAGGQARPNAPAARAEDFPPSSEWIPVKEVGEEHDYVQRQRCRCGGRLAVTSQGTGEKAEKHYDVLQCACTRCEWRGEFVFDVTAIFQQYALALDAKAQQEVFARLDHRWPPTTDVPLDELTSLFRNSNPHVCDWAARRLAQTPAGSELLLEGYLKSGIGRQAELHATIEKSGPLLVDSIAKRLQSDAGQDARWEMISLLGDLPEPKAGNLVEAQLRGLLPKPSRLRRICYIALGRHGSKECEPLLLEAFASEVDPTDDALIWALARCGSARSFPAIRTHFRMPPKTGWSDYAHETLGLAAIAAEGIVGDREAIPRLLEMARSRPEDLPEDALKQWQVERLHEHVRHNAVYALGKLAATEAVPLLIQYLREVPDYKTHSASIGIYGQDGLLPITNSHALDAIRALGSIVRTKPSAELKRQVLAEFRRMLKDDRYYLDHDEIAEAAAQLGWRELAPDVIHRLDKDYHDNLRLFGKEAEKYSPPLRILTGQPFGEDPKPWREWLAGLQAKSEERDGHAVFHSARAEENKKAPDTTAEMYYFNVAKAGWDTVVYINGNPICRAGSAASVVQEMSPWMKRGPNSIRITTKRLAAHAADCDIRFVKVTDATDPHAGETLNGIHESPAEADHYEIQFEVVVPRAPATWLWQRAESLEVFTDADRARIAILHAGHNRNYQAKSGELAWSISGEGIHFLKVDGKWIMLAP